MATSQQIAPRAASTGKALVAGLAVKAGQFYARILEAAKGFDSVEAVAAGGYVAIGLYSIAVVINVALGH
jgi:hypothetical protein